MEIVDDNRIVINLYRYDELVSQLTGLRSELEYIRMENRMLKDTLEERQRLIETLKDLLNELRNN